MTSDGARRPTSATTFTCLDLSFSVRASDPGLQALIEELYAPCTSEEPPQIDFALSEASGPSPAFEVHRDQTRVRTTDSPSLALAHLVWEISQAVVRTSARPGNLLLHAAAASRGHDAVLLPAASGSGKSTLVAALISAGFGYLTDDVVAVDAAGRSIRPYPKPISVPLRLRRQFPQVGPLPTERYRYLGDDGYLTVQELGASIGPPSVARLIVTPRYQANAATEAVALSRARALRLLVEQSFELGSAGPGALDHLASIVAGCRCVSLVYSSLAEAVAVVGEELDRARDATVGEI